MKCLRCGREIGNNTECDCGHFYENNIGENSKNSKRKKQIKTDIKIAIVVLCSIFILIFMFTFLPLLLNEISRKSYEKEKKNKEVCNIKCEGQSYELKSGYCICSDGSKYPIEDK